MDGVLLAVGTQKGLFLGRRGAGGWEFTGPHFPMQAVYSVGIDTRRAAPRLLVGADSSHWGPSVFPALLEAAGVPARNARSIELSLARLRALVA